MKRKRKPNMSERIKQLEQERAFLVSQVFHYRTTSEHYERQASEWKYRMDSLVRHLPEFVK